MPKSRRPDRMIWPSSFVAANRRRIELIRKKPLTLAETTELYALEVMVGAYIDTRWPTDLKRLTDGR